MTLVQDLARFIVEATWDDLSPKAREAIKLRVLDALGCAIGALDGEPIRAIRRYLDDVGGNPSCSLLGGGSTAPDRAAFYNSALVRYLDFNDYYLAVGESCHPSDNLGPALAATQYRGGSGRDFLLALAVGYQVQCRLSDQAPVRAHGFDHVTQGAYAVPAAAAKGLRLNAAETANAISISGTAFNALRVTRTGALSHWKGLAYPNTAFCGVHATLLARRGVTGAEEVFEGNKGFMHSIAGDFELDWSSEDLERVVRTDVKKYNAEGHSQSCIEGLLELREAHQFSAADVQDIDIDVFDVAYNIIGGGEEGDKTVVRTKEEADHSLHYMAAVALLDNALLPEQYNASRIGSSDVQDLLRRITVRVDDDFSSRFPEEHCCRLRVRLNDGRVLEKEKTDYEGFHTRPMSWESVVDKFHALANPYTDSDTRKSIIDTVRALDDEPVTSLTALLERVNKPD